MWLHFKPNERRMTMKAVNRMTGIALAATAAAIFATAPLTAVAHDTEQGKCVGANSWKGQSACKTANSECKGLNSCKGQGFIMATKSECDEKGGEFESM